MARIRSIKPELLEDERTALLTNGEWRLFVSLLLLADDYGNLRANPKQIDGTVFWGTTEPMDVQGMLLVLQDAGLIRLYHVRGQTYAHLCGWSKHQKVDKPGKPLCPGPQEGEPAKTPEKTDIRETVANDSRDSREPDAPDLDLDLDLDLCNQKTDYSPEPKDSASVASKKPEASQDKSPVVIELPMTAGRTFAVTENRIARYRELYPAVDLLLSLKRLAQWLDDNSTRQSATDRGAKKRISTWLGSDQDKARGSPNHSLSFIRPANPDYVDLAKYER